MAPRQGKVEARCLGVLMWLLLSVVAAVADPVPEEDPDNDGDGWDSSWDCDDFDSTVHPEAPEFCNGIDQNCDGVVDGSWHIEELFFRDADGDTYGDVFESQEGACVPEGWVLDDTDCDDSDEVVYPGALEIGGDGIDQNCDGFDVQDNDGDGYTVEVDCDDDDPRMHPGVEDVCNGVDDNCDGDIDDALGEPPETIYWDGDDDGYGNSDWTQERTCLPDGWVWQGDDCDDSDPDAYPGAKEIGGDGVDQDCDGVDADYDPDDEIAIDDHGPPSLLEVITGCGGCAVGPPVHWGLKRR